MNGHKKENCDRGHSRFKMHAEQVSPREAYFDLAIACLYFSQRHVSFVHSSAALCIIATDAATAWSLGSAFLFAVSCHSGRALLHDSKHAHLAGRGGGARGWMGGTDSSKGGEGGGVAGGEESTSRCCAGLVFVGCLIPADLLEAKDKGDDMYCVIPSQKCH